MISHDLERIRNSRKLPLARPKMTRIEILSACVCLAVATCASGDDAPATGNSQVPLERETIIDFLRGFAPDEQQRVQLRSLLQNLDADEFVSRDASMRELLLRPVIPPNMLDDAQESGSTEVRLAIRRLRQSQNPERIEGLLQHAYASIAQQHYQGLCTEVLGSLTFAGRGTTIRGGQAALKATVTRDDVAILRHRLDDTSPVLRRTAAVALAGVTQDAAADGLLSLLNDPMAIVRLEVAVALGNAGRRESLKTLIELLNNERLVVRWRSGAALRALTGTSFGYRPTAVSSANCVPGAPTNSGVMISYVKLSFSMPCWWIAATASQTGLPTRRPVACRQNRFGKCAMDNFSQNRISMVICARATRLETIVYHLTGECRAALVTVASA